MAYFKGHQSHPSNRPTHHLVLFQLLKLTTDLGNKNDVFCLVFSNLANECPPGRFGGGGVFCRGHTSTSLEGHEVPYGYRTDSVLKQKTSLISLSH